MKKLNSKGFAHWILPVVVVVAVASVGAYMVVKSNASTNYAAICGSGFQHKVTAKLNGPYGHHMVFTKGSGAKTNWCAFTVRGGAASGVSGQTMVFLINGNGVQKTDKGYYSRHAGPVKVINSASVKLGGFVTYKGKQYTLPGPAMTIRN